MKKYLVGAILSLGIIVSPALALAQVQGDVAPSQVQSSCISLQNNLLYRSTNASTGGEVSLLQDFLQSEGYLTSEPTGYFGLLTMNAVKSFQSANGILSSGYVGPITRAKIKALTCGDGTTTTTTTSTLPTGCRRGDLFNSLTGQRCSDITTPAGCPPGALYNSLNGERCSSTTVTQPSITGSVSGSTVTATYANLPANSYIQLVNQATGNATGYVSLPLSGAGLSGNGSAAITGSVPVGTYFLRVKRSVNGNTDTMDTIIVQSSTFVVGGTSTATINPIYPVAIVSSFSTIISGKANNTTNFSLSMSGPGGDKVWSSHPPVVGGNWSVTVSPALSISGTYTVIAYDNNVELARTSFYIPNLWPTQSFTAPSASLSINGSKNLTILVGTPYTWNWSSTVGTSWSSSYTSNASYCGSGTWVANSANGSNSGTITSAMAGCNWVNKYTVTGPGGTITDTVYLSVPSTTVTAPTITSFTAFPSSITSGSSQSSTLSWTSTGADTTFNSCNLDANGVGLGSKPANGSFSVSPTVTTTYNLVCAKYNPTTLSALYSSIAHVTVTVSASTTQTCTQPHITTPSPLPGYSIGLSPGQTGVRQSFVADQAVSYSLRNSPSWVTLSTGGSNSVDSVTFGNIPTTPGTYNFTIVATNGCGASDTETIQVIISNGSATLDQSSMASPSGTPTISGTARNTSAVLVVISNSSGRVYGSGIVGNNGGRWSVTVSPALASGTYTTQVYNYYSNALLASGTLTVTGQTTVAPTITSFTAFPSSITSGSSQSSTLSWTSTGADTTFNSCNLDANGVGLGSKPANGSFSVSPTVTTTYNLVCAKYNPTTLSALYSSIAHVTVTVSAPVALTAPTGLAYSCSSSGTPVTLSWSPVTGASSYTVRADNMIKGLNDNPCTGTTGDYCNESASGTSINVPIIAGDSHRWWVHARDTAGNWSSASSFGSFNCPSSVTMNTSTNQTASALNAFGDATQSPSITQGTTDGFSYTLTQDMYRGTQGSEVVALQRALHAEGLFAGEATGNFYDVTREAVIAFQIKYGINPTGYVGSETRAKLNALY